MIADPRLLVPDPAQAEVLAGVHASAFEPHASWSAQAFLDLGAPPQGAVISDLALGVLALRFAADEAEVLTLAVRPDAQGQGIGKALMGHGFSSARRNGAARMFLEVAVDNAAALALYRRLGFAEIARRKGYYRRDDGDRVDAVVMSVALEDE